MKREFLKIIEHFSERKAINKTTKVSIFFICFTISLFIWLLIKMSNEYTTDINFPVKYINPPANQILTHTKDTVISIKLTSRGFELLNVMFYETRSALNINLSGSNILKNQHTSGNYILTKDINTQILNQLEYTDRITKISSDTLRFELEQIISKKIVVISDIRYAPKVQHQIYGEIKISPDSITISGPPSILDKIDSIKTKAARFLDIEKDINTRLELSKPIDDNKLTLSPDSVNLYIPVQKVTENVIEIPIVIRNADSNTIKLFPENVKATYIIALKDYSNFQTDMLSIGIRFDKNKNRQTLEVFRQPSFIKITNLEPETVEYIIIK